MTKEQLNRANEIRKEIDDLEGFLKDFSRIMKLKFVIKEVFATFLNNRFNTNVTIKDNLAYKIKDTIENHVKELKSELDSI